MGQVARRLVEDQQPAPAQICACEADALSLPARAAFAELAEPRREAVRERVEPGTRADGAQRRLDRGVVGAGAAMRTFAAIVVAKM